MKRFSKLAATFLILMTFLLSGPVLAQDSQKGIFRNIIAVFHPPSVEERQKIATTVGMSDEQKMEMKAVADRYQTQAQTLLGKYQTAYNNVVKLMNTSNPDKTTVNTKLKNFHRVHQNVVDAEVQYWIDFKSILTPEQNKKFWNMFEQSRIRG